LGEKGRAMSESSAKALVLDFGGVISRTLFETHDLSEAALGLPPGSLTWRGPFDPASDSLWREMQDGLISERDYWTTRARQVGEMLGESWSQMETFVQRARGDDVQNIIRPEAVDAITKAQAAGCRLAILSNELDLFYGQGFRERLPLLQKFDVIVDASHTGILKPDFRAYQMCAQQLGIELKDCVFVDDQMRNIQGGLEAGMQCVHLDVRAPHLAYRKALQLMDVAG
jgi:putative hydrolase of the HAD superfamily